MIELDVNGNRIESEEDDICLVVNDKFNLSPCSDREEIFVYLEETKTGEFLELNSYDVDCLIKGLKTVTYKLKWVDTIDYKERGED